MLNPIAEALKLRRKTAAQLTAAERFVMTMARAEWALRRSQALRAVQHDEDGAYVMLKGRRVPVAMGKAAGHVTVAKVVRK